jgi:GAF domain-containing protein
MSGSPSGSTEWTRSRLETLVAANSAVVAERSLDALLQLVAERSREVVEAEYAALALTSPDGVVDQVIYSGVDEQTQAALREHSRGTGVLSQLFADEGSGPPRLRMIGSEELLSGGSSTDRLVTSFLGVAVHSSSTTYGNLYLGNPVGRTTFDEQDETLVMALAATAGIAIENARLHDGSRRRHDWLQASADISRHLLGGEDSAPQIRHIAEHVRRLSPADNVSVVLPGSGTSGTLRVAVSTGQGAEELQGMEYLVTDSLAWQAMRSGCGLIADDGAQREAVYSQVRSILPATQMMAIPLRGDGPARGALVILRASTSPFTSTDLTLAESFANQATLALELAEARQDHHRLAVTQDRARIARDLHDHVIQKLFAAGLTLQAALASIPEVSVRQRLTTTVSKIDDAIRSIRAAIHELQTPSSP